MKKAIKLTVIITIIALLGACAARGPFKEKILRVKDMRSNDLGMIYGQIIMPSDMWYMRHVEIIQRGKVYFSMGSLSGEKIHVSPDGKFVAVNIKPGEYMLSGFLIGEVMGMLGKRMEQFKVNVKPGGIHYMGGITYIEGEAGGLFKSGTFGLEYDKSKARRAEILNWVSKSTVNTKWHPLVEKEFKKYKRYLPKEKKVNEKKKKGSKS